jgi:anthranilate 1,2-dioxygenase large subunit
MDGDGIGFGTPGAVRDLAGEGAPVWPAADFSRVPHRVYVDPRVYAREQERIFRGPTWSYLGLEAEIPNPGDYVVTSVGDTSVILDRNADGEPRAFVNRCAHRGALVCQKLRGHVDAHVCVYHQWTFDLNGELVGVPYRRGIRGQGGMPKDFDLAAYPLRKLRVESLHGLVFGTFDETVEPLERHLGDEIRGFLERTFPKPLRVLGYNRQRVPANWKLYVENVKDPYHAGLLHLFHATFGTYRSTQKGGVALDPLGRHSAIFAKVGTDDAGALKDAYAQTSFESVGENASPFTLSDPSLLAGRREFDDGISNLIVVVFPSLVVQQIANTLATRKVVPIGCGEFELFWTYVGYADDDAELEAMRLKQANLIGPAGLISMEDGEATRIVQQAVRRENEAHSVIEMGGRGEIAPPDHLVTEVPIRGMWREYCRLMGYEAADAA